MNEIMKIEINTITEKLNKSMEHACEQMRTSILKEVKQIQRQEPQSNPERIVTFAESNNNFKDNSKENDEHNMTTYSRTNTFDERLKPTKQIQNNEKKTYEIYNK